MFLKLKSLPKILYNFNSIHKMSSFSWRNIKWGEIRRFMQVHRHYLKYDNMPPGSKLVYNLPCAHYFINSYILIVPLGSVFLLANVAYYNTRFLSLTKEDFITSPYVKKPHEYYVFLSSIFLIVVMSLKFTHDWPIRIYRQNNMYTALFINKMNPFKIVRYNFEEMSKAKTWKLSVWHDSKYSLDNKKTIGLFEHHVEPPIEYFHMMTPKSLRK